MSRFVASATVPVRVGDCECPGSPHDGREGRDDGDLIYLRPRLTLEGGLASEAAMVSVAGGSASAVQQAIGTEFVIGGVVAWNLLDDEGEEVPVTPEAIRSLTWETLQPVAEKANDLYADSVISPLVARLSRLLPSTPTEPSTSPSSGPEDTPPTPSGPSSPATSEAGPPYGT